MVELDSDGSIKLPENLARNREENKTKLKFQRCIRVKRERVNFSAQKKCILHLTLSDAITDDRFVGTIYGYFKNKASVPTSLRKISEKQFDVEIGTDFRE